MSVRYTFMLLSLMSLMSLMLLIVTTESQARSQRVSQIPNGSRFSCANCHVNPGGGGSRNAFGQAIESGFLNGSGSSASVNWNAQLAGLDSDGDGATNGTELGDPDGNGSADAGVTVTNPGDASSVPQIQNRAPVLGTIGGQSVLEGEALSFTVTASDDDGDTVTITASGLPSGATFTSNTFTWTPGFDDGGQTVTVSFVATDGQLDVNASTSIVVTNVNRAPTISSIETQAVREGETLSFDISSSDADGDDLTITSADLPDGATLVGDTFTWVPGFDLGGQTVMVTFVATDGDLDASLSVDVVVEDVNQPARIDASEPAPGLTISSDGSSVSFSVAAVDPEGEELTFDWTVNGISLGSTNTFVLDVLGADDDLVVVTVSSSDGSSATQSWTVTRGLKGDFDGNGAVQFGDFLRFAGGFGSTSASPDWDPLLDLNGDDRVDFTDFLTFAQFFGLSE